jgi:hypothetical protein
MSLTLVEILLVLAHSLSKPCLFDISEVDKVLARVKTELAVRLR